jgi:hypothetical protein
MTVSSEEIKEFLNKTSVSECTRRTVKLRNNLITLIESMASLLEDEKIITAMTGLNVTVTICDRLPTGPEEDPNDRTVKSRVIAVMGQSTPEHKNVILNMVEDKF